jgi:hypothetical protein
MKRFAPFFAIIALLAAYHAAGVLWGRDGNLYVLIGILGLYAVVTLAVFIIRRRLRREHPDLAETLNSDSDALWYWRVLDVAMGVSFAFGPPLIVSVIRRQPLSLESEFTGYHLLAMASGGGVYLLGRAYVVRQWQLRHQASKDATNTHCT